MAFFEKDNNASVSSLHGGTVHSHNTNNILSAQNPSNTMFSESSQSYHRKIKAGQERNLHENSIEAESGHGMPAQYYYSQRIDHRPSP
jgi:hypothetical protein